MKRFFSRIRWRIAAPFSFLITLLLGGVIWILTNTNCAGSCAFWLFVGSVLLGVAATAAITIFVAQPIKQLTAVLSRVAEGDTSARILTKTTTGNLDLSRILNRVVDKLQNQINALDEERQRFSSVLSLMADGVLITDSQGKVQLINPAAMRLLNTSKEEAIGRSFAEVAYHHQLIDLWQRCRETGREQTAAIEISLLGLFMQATFSLFHDKRHTGILVLLQDLTAIRRLESVRRDFISNVSHELRTPIASIKALVETLQDGAVDDPPAAQRFLARAEHEVDAMTQIVEELLTLSRIESGQVPLKLEPTAVSDIFMRPVERLVPLAERKELELILSLPAQFPPVLADLEQVQQVVTNLVHNAIKHTPERGKITIKAHCADDQSEVVFTISDTGVGIAAEDLSRIFERFYKAADRARQRHEAGGTGLGLAIAKHIIHAHGGRIWAKSKEGKGSTFYFLLPTV